ncbi:MAG: FKBP-type peptidyl-prolyl cis-trans isomerase [Saprospiraceae bacterium]
MIIKKIKISAIVTALFLSVSSIALAQNLSNKLDSVSYSVGAMFAKSLKQQGITEINDDVVAKALKDFLTGTKPAISEMKCEELYRGYIADMRKIKMEKSKMEGKNFMAENAKRLEVTVTESGLQYEVLKSGTGPRPKATDKVKTHYHGMLIDGTVFDSSVDRGEPISFPVGGVIKGWQEALQLMHVGDKWKLVIPSELAYGSRGAGAAIGPDATLVFEVELLGIE